MEVEKIKENAIKYDQGHIFDQWETLSPSEQHELINDIQKIDFNILKDAISKTAIKNDIIKPVKDNICTIKDRTEEMIEKYRDIGYEMISQNKVAMLLLSGGQGTRLKFNKPKGCYKVGLPSGKSLFQIQAERIYRLQELVLEKKGKKCKMRWYVMTSEFTTEDIKEYFKEQRYFGLEEDQVVFFEQGNLPCINEEGKIIMESKTKISKAPNGNGGVFMALEESGCLKDMEKFKIECVDSYCVDNLLAKMADPLFIGYCKTEEVECGARVVSKRDANEKVGVFAVKNDRVQVIEYSELDEEMAKAVNMNTSQLEFNWANICMHYYSLSFLKSASNYIKTNTLYHIAKKEIPSISGIISGIKLELFNFDVFPMVNKVCLFEIERNSEFACVKNASGSETDTPETARQYLMNLHKKWIEDAGGHVEGNVEISPLVSYNGENLKKYCSGKYFKNNYHLTL